ncbi:MAG: M1 family metallopeptidase [Flavobacteriales bacterium]|nr:M1 family metallopeptidase [Flavobacteriales bacterium]
MQLYKSIIIIFLFGVQLTSYAQKEDFTHQDTLRGTITPERAWWDLTYYHLSVKVNIKKKTLSGSNLIKYKVLEPHQTLQIELQEPLKITKIIQEKNELKFKKDGYSYFIQLDKKQSVNDINELTIFYEGTPQESKNPPWSGGLTWKKDNNGNPWVVTTCQGIGASIWWPNKDHAYDEPDSMLISVTVPKNLTDVSNGRLRSVIEKGNTKTFNWFVSNPINNYGVNMNIGDYVHFNEVYKGLNDDLACDYYVLRNNLEVAKKQFKEVPRMLKAFEHWFGPYPFYKDGYKLVEVPYAGMEHQSSVTYGNGFKNGYWGRDISGTGWGMKFDFIIVHESGHEWFANNITHVDVADMWIHEGFTSYSESLFLDYHFGTEACNEYVQGVRENIGNDRPIIGTYNVHHEGSGDMYNKGSNILHTLRQLIEDDALWRSILTGLNKEFHHQTVTSKQVEDYLSEKTGKDLSAFFNQYLRTTKIPKLEYIINDEALQFRYVNVVENFDMPIRILINEKEKWIFPSENWNAFNFEEKGINLSFDDNFYIEYKGLPDD